MSKHNFREIAVDSDGELLVSVDGKLTGPAEYVKKAKRNSILREPVRLVYPHGEFFESNLEDGEAFGEVAALMSVNPGRSRVLTAPPEVMDYLAGDDSDSSEDLTIIEE